MNTTTSAATVEVVAAAEREQAKRAVEAVVLRCACIHSVRCPRHFPAGYCIGSHD